MKSRPHFGTPDRSFFASRAAKIAVQAHQARDTAAAIEQFYQVFDLRLRPKKPLQTQF
jgi:hypothetical protein